MPLARTLKIETTIKIPLRTNPDGGKPRFARYQLQRRGKIAQLLKSKPKRI